MLREQESSVSENISEISIHSHPLSLTPTPVISLRLKNQQWVPSQKNTFLFQIGLSLRRLKNQQWVPSQKIPSCFKQILPPHTAPWLPRGHLFFLTDHQGPPTVPVSPFFLFLLKDNSFTGFCCLLSNLNMNHMIYICPLPFEPPSLTCLRIHACSLGVDWSPSSSSSGGFVFHHIALNQFILPRLCSLPWDLAIFLIMLVSWDPHKALLIKSWPGHTDRPPWS